VTHMMLSLGSGSSFCISFYLNISLFSNYKIVSSLVSELESIFNIR